MSYLITRVREAWSEFWRYRRGSERLLAKSRSEAMRELLRQARYQPNPRWRSTAQ